MHSSSLARAATVAALTLGVVPAGVSAQITPGSRLEFSGTVNATDIGAAGIVLAFAPGTIVGGTANTGVFAFLNAAFPAGAPGTIRNFTVGVGPIALPGVVTMGGYTFDLVAIPAGTFGQDDCYVEPAAGQRCTPIQAPAPHPSPFDLENFASGDPAAPFNSVASFDVHGVVRAPDGATADFVGTISTRFPGMSFQEALMTVEAVGIAGIHFDASFVAVATTVPEPGSPMLLSSGLIGLLGVVRCARRSAGKSTGEARTGGARDG